MLNVVFRKFKDQGDIIAILRDSETDCNTGMIMTYQTVGQHSEACKQAIIELTRPCKDPKEYKDLLTELENIYNTKIKVFKRLK